MLLKCYPLAQMLMKVQFSWNIELIQNLSNNGINTVSISSKTDIRPSTGSNSSESIIEYSLPER
jgi:hypothetical protein